jgi:hypothetical protein
MFLFKDNSSPKIKKLRLEVSIPFHMISYGVKLLRFKKMNQKQKTDVILLKFQVESAIDVLAVSLRLLATAVGCLAFASRENSLPSDLVLRFGYRRGAGTRSFSSRPSQSVSGFSFHGKFLVRPSSRA